LFGIVSGGDLVLKNLSTSGVVNVVITDFFGSGSGFSLFTFGEGKEAGESLLFEEMGISGELVE
jgi:hypothetical protein